MQNSLNLSYWEESTWFSSIDFLIIGSGIVGLSAAITLKKRYPGKKVLILERGMLPSGASSKNAGFACFGSPSEILDDLEKKSEDEVFRLVEKRWTGLKKLRSLVGEKEMDFQPNGSFEIFTDEKEYERCSQKLDYLNRHLKEITGDEDVYIRNHNLIKEFGFNKVSYLIKNRLEGQIDTGKMITSLIKKAIFEGVLILNCFQVDSIEDNGKEVIINNPIQELKACKVIVATNGFAKQLLPELEVAPARAQVMVTSPIKDLNIKGTFHYDKGYYYFRNIHDRILLGGGRNLDFHGEETFSFGMTEQIQNSLELLLKEVILPGQDYRIEQRWSGIMGVGNSKSTIVKPVSENVVCAVRMGGMGVAIGSLIGEEAAGLL
jgi:gamma-glutamylputrescine oxidase